MSVRVVARIRPLLDKELDRDIIVRSGRVEAGKHDTIVRVPNPKKDGEEFSFAFNSVYDHTTTQETLFNSEVQPHLKSLFQGFDVTIFAYGVTGTGKTHTMRGGLKLADRGVIPRLLSNVFRRGRKLVKDSDGQTTVRVSLSYYEIYNDKVFDLLEPPEKRTPAGLPLRAEANGRTVVAGLSERACDDLRDFEKLYIEANANRVTAATKLNAHSSRSHAVLRVKLTQTTADGAVVESTASAIDLAGSEDNRRTDNGKERLVESAAINKSLFVLSQCIEAVARGDKRVPYRESKMTRILSLGQNKGITVMILNLAPLRSYHLDTLSSLNVSSRAKRIEVREIENDVVCRQPASRIANPAAHGIAAAASAARQPLRPLTNAHNVHSGIVAAAATAEMVRPVKAFSVYADRSDRSRAVPAPLFSSSSSSAALVATAAVAARSATLINTSSTATGTTLSASTSHLVPRPIMPKRHAEAERERASHQPRATRPANEAPHITMSAAEIEAMVERKVGEMLAARTAAGATAGHASESAHYSSSPPSSSSSPPSLAGPPQSDLSEEVARRLEALERRVEGDEWRSDARSDGLRYLLAARQHKLRGDFAAALRAYELALPYFPDQIKLLNKMERLRNALGMSERPISQHATPVAEDEVAAIPEERRARSAMSHGDEREWREERYPQREHCDEQEWHARHQQRQQHQQHRPRPQRQVHHQDEVRRGDSCENLAPRGTEGSGSSSSSSNNHTYSDGDDSGSWKPQRRNKSRPRPLPQPPRAAATAAEAESAVDATLPTSPRSRRLLETVNSRDVMRIHGLAGFGTKRAQELAEQLERAARAGNGPLESLEQLQALPGMGWRTVERAHAGLAAAAARA